MEKVHYELIYRRIDDLLDQATELASHTNEEILKYLLSMAQLELDEARAGKSDTHFARGTCVTRST